MLQLRATIVLIGYLGITVAYTFVLKRLAVIDVITLGGLYTIRIVAGAAAISVHLTIWLLTFSVFLFTSLAIVKRMSELERARRMVLVRYQGARRGVRRRRRGGGRRSRTRGS